ncbi:MAG: MFS transporter [Gemmatimonadota bacterium]|nr:MFS transporter [Gemmatimonadota bacterium]MDE2677670.1 MFS transporter [Gemmatimonadota bacterium]
MSYDKRTVRSWVLYDFANSIYPAVITTAVYPLFYVGVVVNDEGGRGEFWWGLAVSLSALLVAFSSPLLGAIADRSGVRKKFFGFYVAVCLIGVALMTTLQPGMVIAGFLFFVIANVGFESAVVFYNAYLPDIAPPEQLGEVSGKGFGWGYLGSALGLLLVLPFGMQEQYHLIWPTVVAFFILFSIPAFRVLPADGPGQMRVGQAAIHGIRKVKALAAEVWRIPNMRRFLFAYFFFIDGVLTIIAMAGVIAKETFGFTTDGVIILFLIVQFSAMAGALAMAKPTDRLGPKMVLTGVLIMWVAAGIAAYFIQSQMEFYVLAIVAGIGLGTVQSASRAFMASLVPDGREAQMFGFYALCGRSSSVLGPFLFGLAVLWAGGNQRPGFLVLTAFFLIGLILLQRVVDPKAPPKTA